MPPASKSRPRAKTAAPRVKPRRKRRWLRYLVAAFAGPLILIVSVLSYYYVTLSRVIEMRLHGEVEKSWPRIYARPLELRAGQSLTADGLIERLNDLGYAGRPHVTEAGQFAVGDITVMLGLEGGRYTVDIDRCGLSKDGSSDGDGTCLRSSFRCLYRLYGPNRLRLRSGRDHRLFYNGIFIGRLFVGRLLNRSGFDNRRDLEKRLFHARCGLRFR